MVVRQSPSSTKRLVDYGVPSTAVPHAYVVQAKTTKKVVLRLECTVCKYKMQLALKRCKQYVVCRSVTRAINLLYHSSFELGGEKKTKGAALQFVRGFRLIVSCVSDNMVKVSCMSSSFIFRVSFVMYPTPHYDMQSTTCSSPVLYTIRGPSYICGVRYLVRCSNTGRFLAGREYNSLSSNTGHEL